MTVKLPDILDRYYKAQNAHAIDAMAACFTSDAVVRDERHEHVGAAAIRAWIIDTSTRYRVTSVPLECRDDGDSTIVVAKVSGTFDGSPLNLTYRFRLSADGRIGALEIG